MVQERALGKEFHRSTYAQDLQKGWTFPGLHSTLRKGVHYNKTSPSRAGVDAKQICAITKHRNEQSLTSCIKDSSASDVQKRACSEILCRPFLSKEVSDVDMACSNSMAGGKVHVRFAATSETHLGRPKSGDHFNPRLAARAKMSLSRAQNIFMPANINSIVILTINWPVLSQS